MRRSVHWIPAGPLVFAQFAQLAAWLVLLATGLHGGLAPSPLGLAWLHLIVLGWLTTVALAFLLHVIPAFTDTAWSGDRLARASLWPYQAGVIVLVTGFATWRPTLIEIGGALVTASLAVYLTTALVTLAAAAHSSDRTTRAVARAMSMTLLLLSATVLAGTILADGLRTGTAAWLRWIPAHATLGLFGWLGALVVGVSARTHNRLIGRWEPRRRIHIAVGSLIWIGVLAIVVGIATNDAILSLGGRAALALGAVVYAVDNLRAAARASTRHVLPVLFVVAAQIWLLLAAGLGLAFPGDAALQAAFACLLLLGWIGQSVNAHLAHVGIRLLATIILGDDDETPPAVLLSPVLGTASFICFQAAVACVSLGTLQELPPLIAAGAILGIAGFAFFAWNVGVAARNARRLHTIRPISLVLSE
jgi:hypothetical protein